MKKLKTNTGEIILVDDEDYPILSRFPWYKGGKDGGRPMTFIYGQKDTSHTVYMHQIILGGVVFTDHEDGNPYNMQKKNLRKATHSQNGGNARKMRTRKGKPLSSKYKGVTWNANSGKWKAVCTKDRKRHHLGEYRNETDAALAYNKKAKELFGNFSRLNVINHQARTKGCSDNG